MEIKYRNLKVSNIAKGNNFDLLHGNGDFSELIRGMTFRHCDGCGINDYNPKRYLHVV